MSDVKAEVNRSMELEELRRMQGEFQRAAQDIHSSVNSGLQEAGDAMNQAWSGASSGATPAADGGPIHYRPKKVNWRLKRSATPVWFKQRQRVRTRALSGAARVARYRPKSLRGPR
jgi:sec-independent protein translocase protein TatB